MLKHVTLLKLSQLTTLLQILMLKVVAVTFSLLIACNYGSRRALD